MSVGATHTAAEKRGQSVFALAVGVALALSLIVPIRAVQHEPLGSDAALAARVRGWDTGSLGRLFRLLGG